ncbi:MAG: gamma-glutamyltransferase family protein, partial [Actinomycetota bacterium]|nr:gamma-glutamyltransferase family protein [Actinomycetota bacterium]
LTRGGLARLAPALARVPSLDGRSAGERAVALAASLGAPDGAGHTTNLVTADSEGNACVMTTSLGLGSGDFLPGFDVHLNSMLGEADLLVGRLEPGERMKSMMAPTAVLDGSGLEVASGSAGGTRLRSALVQVLAAILDEGDDPQAAVDRPRLHPAGEVVHLEPGFADDALRALEGGGWTLRCWPVKHHYFGGVSLVARSGAAADPRRSGAVRRPA